MTNHRNGEPIDVLLVEDNPGDVRLTEEAFEEGSINNELYVASTGEEAMDFLYQRGEYEESPRPHLVLLDLNLPGKDGHEVLEDIREDDHLQRIPVIVLTSSKAEEDVVRSYELSTNAYLTKPIGPDEFMELVRSFEQFWFTMVKLPPKPE